MTTTRVSDMLPLPSSRSTHSEVRALRSCRLCAERGRPEEFASEPLCAFPDGGRFNGENWQCATANALREAIGTYLDHPEEIAWMVDGDQSHVTIPHGRDGWHDGTVGPLALWVTWYKDRGQTIAMWLLFEEEPPRLPTEADVRHIIKDVLRMRATAVGAKRRPSLPRKAERREAQ